MTMSKEPVVQFGVFYVLLLPGVFGFVPSPTNVSVVCHNFVNVLYWNYSKPTEQLKFSVLVKPYESASRTVDTSQTYLDISSYSGDVGDDYFVSVTAHDGQEISERASIRFTYSKDYFNINTHKYKCSLDFPAVNTSVHKHMIKASFQHPFMLHKQVTLNGEFVYTITHDERKFLYSCFEVEELCTAEIYLNQSAAGQRVELKFEGKIAGIHSYTYRNVSIPRQTPETDNTGIIAALLGGGTIVLSIIIGFVWLLWRKWSKIPKMPHWCIIPRQYHTMLVSQPEMTDISPVTSQGPPSSPVEEDCKTVLTLDGSVIDHPEVSAEDMDFEDSGSFGRSSDYDSPKFLQEMSPGDSTEGYGPRPPVL
ncbi:interferon gamma receptor 1-like [Puntigrus tetrazona]|uniref:interferon gamma receptor 1-like n=1 Tax=Puntigrus tetrazona TaxID=1606681 RepID=UPI001C8A2D55|nr:interferon gamma receptor 1-like [Puntigrus tetrazona]